MLPVLPVSSTASLLHTQPPCPKAGCYKERWLPHISATVDRFDHIWDEESKFERKACLPSLSRPTPPICPAETTSAIIAHSMTLWMCIERIKGLLPNDSKAPQRKELYTNEIGGKGIELQWRLGNPVTVEGGNTLIH